MNWRSEILDSGCFPASTIATIVTENMIVRERNNAPPWRR